MIFLNFLKLLLLVAGPLVGYQVAMRQLMARRWQVGAPLVSRDYPHAMFLICVPGGMPRLARPLENVVNVYNVSALPRHSRVRSSLRAEGWLGSIPRECLGDSVKR